MLNVIKKSLLPQREKKSISNFRELCTDINRRKGTKNFSCEKKEYFLLNTDKRFVLKIQIPFYDTFYYFSLQFSVAYVFQAKK